MKHLFVGRFRLRCDNEPSIRVVADKAKSKMPDRVEVETSPRHSSASNGLAERAIRTNREQLRTLRYDTQNRDRTRIAPDSVIWPWMVRYAGFSVARYARGTGGITLFRVVSDRDYTQVVAPFAETALFKILARGHRGLSSGKRLIKETLCGTKGTWFGKSETNPEHVVATKNGAMEARTIRRLEPTRRSETVLVLKIQGAP